MDDVEAEFLQRLVAEFGGPAGRIFRAQDDLPDQGTFPFREGKRQDVRRPVVAEVLAIELVQSRIIEKGQTDIRLGNTFLRQHEVHQLPDFPSIDGKDLLSIGNLDVNHGQTAPTTYFACATF